MEKVSRLITRCRFMNFCTEDGRLSEDLRFSVLALGDSSYEFFCQTGKEFDQRLEELGGKRISPRVDCDLDYDEPAAEWLEGVLKGLNEAGGGSAAPAPAAASQTGESSYSRTNPFRAEVLENLNLNGRGSNKETRHVELSLEGSGLTYEPGDSLGVYPENDPELVELLLKEMNWDPEEIVTLNKQGDVRPLKEALISHYEITVLTKPLLEQAAQLTGNDELRELLAPGNEENVKPILKGAICLISSVTMAHLVYLRRSLSRFCEKCLPAFIRLQAVYPQIRMKCI